LKQENSKRKKLIFVKFALKGPLKMDNAKKGHNKTGLAKLVAQKRRDSYIISAK